MYATCACRQAGLTWLTFACLCAAPPFPHTRAPHPPLASADLDLLPTCNQCQILTCGTRRLYP